MDTDCFDKSPIRFLKPPELAALLGISKATVYRFIEKRTLPSYKIGGSMRFKESDVLEYIEKCRIQSADELYEHTKTRK